MCFSLSYTSLSLKTGDQNLNFMIIIPLLFSTLLYIYVYVTKYCSFHLVKNSTLNVFSCNLSFLLNTLLLRSIHVDAYSCSPFIFTAVWHCILWTVCTIYVSILSLMNTWFVSHDFDVGNNATLYILMHVSWMEPPCSLDSPLHLDAMHLLCVWCLHLVASRWLLGDNCNKACTSFELKLHYCFEIFDIERLTNIQYPLVASQKFQHNICQGRRGRAVRFYKYNVNY